MIGMTGDPALIDRSALTDATRCPSCGARLSSARCGHCGVDLSGPVGIDLWQLSQQVAALLGRRDGLLRQLRDAARATPVPAPAPVVAAPPARMPRARSRRPVRVQSLLVGLGALLLAVAAVVFLAFSWERMSLGARAAVIAAGTLAVLAVAGRLRPRLADTAEAVGALGVVLVLADAWAVRRLGVLGADRPLALVYAAGAAAACGALLAGWAALTRVRAGSVAACVLLPAAVALAGIGPVAHGLTDGRIAVLALLAATAVTPARWWLPAAWSAERWVLRAVAAGSLLAALAGCVPVGIDRPGSVAGLMLLAAGVTALQAPAGRAEPVERVWSAAAGAVIAAAAVPAAIWVLRTGDWDGAWALGLVPALGVATVPVLRRGLTRVAGGAAAVAGALTVPALVTVATSVTAAAAIAVPAWQLDAARALGAATASPGVAFWAGGVLGVAALAGLLAAWPRLRRLAPWPATLLLVPAALCPPVRVWVVAVLLVGLALGAAAAVARGVPVPARPALLGLAVTAGTLGVVLGWAVRPLSVPFTLLGVAGLLAARALRPPPAVRAGLAAGTTGALVIAAGAVPAMADRPPADVLLAAGLTGAGLVALVSCLSGWRGSGGWAQADRIPAALPALSAWLIATAAVAESPQRRLLLAAGLAAAVIVAVSGGRRVGPVPPALGAASAPPLLSALAAALVLQAPAGIVAAAVVAAGGAATAALVLAAGLRDSRRTALEAGLALTALAALAQTPDQTSLWLVLLGVGTGAAAIAATPGRHRVGWLSGVLLTASTWTRLELADVGLVEAYTLPPALALLAVGLLRLRRDPVARARRVLLPALGLGVLPSVLAAADGDARRPAILLALAALAVTAGWLRPGRLGPLLLGAAAVAASGVGILRPLAGSLPGAGGAADVELWSLTGAAVVLAAAVLALRSGLAGGRATVARLVAAVPALVAGLPSLVAAAMIVPGAGWRAGAVLAAALGVTLLLAARSADYWQVPLAVAALATLTGVGLGAGPAVEAWTLPLGGCLLALGTLRLQRRRTGGSWPALSAGLAITLLPGLLLATAGGGSVRVVGFAVLATAVLLAGAVLRWQAPLLAGALALGVHALVQLAPWLAQAYQALPRWLVLGALGVLLLAVGATYEQRLQQVRLARHRLLALR